MSGKSRVLGTITELRKKGIIFNPKKLTRLLVPTIEYSQKEGSYKRQGYKSKKILRICQNCQIVFWIWEGWLKKKTRKNNGMFCSISCRQKVNIHKYLLASGKHIHPMSEARKQIQREAMMGEKNRAWKGGITYFKTHGNYKGVKYIRCPQKFISMARKDGYAMEHRIIMAQKIGRSLTRIEVVHHIDHDPTNNKIENLQLFKNNQEHKKAEGSPIYLQRQKLVRNIIKASSSAQLLAQVVSSQGATAKSL